MIQDLKELEKLLKICRKQGVTDITFEGVSVKLGPLPLKVSGEESEEYQIETEINPEQMFYAMGNQL